MDWVREKESILRSSAAGGLWGLMVGDALGVPVEFTTREQRKADPVTDMRGYGTHSQPAGTWSDDSSLMLCTMDSLRSGIDYSDIMERFVRWLFHADYTPYGDVFDVGLATSEAIYNYRDGKPVRECGGRNEQDNGNGSLMRILPVALYQYFHCNHFLYNDREKLLAPIHTTSALTHAHPVSMIGCGLYASLIADAINVRCGFPGCNWPVAQWSDYEQNGYGNIYGDDSYQEAIQRYNRLRDLGLFAKLPEAEILSSGYVVHTLEAAVWCLLNTSSFEECVLKAVNLGRDTDTVGAVAGGLAGIKYGVEGIPEKWRIALARYNWIEELINAFLNSLIELGESGEHASL